MSGCSTFSGGSKIHKSARGSVYLENVTDWAYESSHPAIIDQATMLKIVKGLYADDSASPSSKMPAAGSKPMRVFSDEDAEFLAPLLAQGLSQAKPEQIVGFMLSSSTGSGPEPTAGTLYIQQGAVHLTIIPSRSMKTTGFMPASLAHVEKAPSYVAGGSTGAMSLAIDYQALSKTSMPPPMAAATNQLIAPQNVAESTPPAISQPESAAMPRVIPASNSIPARTESIALNNEEMLNKKLDELQRAREANEAKTTEIKVLRKELEWMKRELRERTDEIKAMQAKLASRNPVSKKKTAEARPIR